jgi:hypothetical protein
LYAKAKAPLNFSERSVLFAMELENSQKLGRAISNHTFANAFFWTERPVRFAEKNVTTTPQTNQKS